VTGLLVAAYGIESTGMLTFALMIPALALAPQLPRMAVQVRNEGLLSSTAQSDV